MFARASRPFIFSVLLHSAVVAGLALLFTLATVPPQPMEPARVLEVFPERGFSSASATQMRASAEVSPTIAFKPVRVVAPVREQDESPTSEPTSVPVPATAKATVVSRTTTIAEHRRLHTRPVAPIQAPATRPARIDVNDVLEAGGPRAVLAAPASGDAEAEAYIARLVAALRGAHEKTEGLDEGLTAEVEFVLHADGRVSAVRILQTSGNPAFDASVVEAFRRLRAPGPAPVGTAGRKRIVFRMQAA